MLVSLLYPIITLAACSTCKAPIHSWDTVPIFFHCSTQIGDGKGGFSSEDLDLIEKFPIVTIEKWQGCGVTPRVSEFEAFQISASQIKKRNPNITVIAWIDSIRIYTQSKKLNPDILAPCTAGNFDPSAFLQSGVEGGTELNLHSPYLAQNSSGLPALEPWSGCHIYNFKLDFVRNFWTDMCLNLTKSGNIDGCGADASYHDSRKYGLTPSEQDLWNKGHQAMMKNTSDLLGPGGVLLGKKSYEAGSYVYGVLEETCAASGQTIRKLQNLTATANSFNRTFTYECHGKGTLDELASFLIGAGTGHFYGFGEWYSHKAIPEKDHYLPEFSKKLGEPLSPGQLDSSTGVWTRRFASGTHVTFNEKNNTGHIEWAE